MRNGVLSKAARQFEIPDVAAAAIPYRDLPKRATMVISQGHRIRTCALSNAAVLSEICRRKQPRISGASFVLPSSPSLELPPPRSRVLASSNTESVIVIRSRIKRYGRANTINTGKPDGITNHRAIDAYATHQHSFKNARRFQQRTAD